MDTEEKTEGVLEKNTHKFVLGGQLFAILSILALVPFFRKVRAERYAKAHKRHFLVFGH